MTYALPRQYTWLTREPAPRLLIEFLKLHGTQEDTGPDSNPVIINWAKEIGLWHVYKNDEIAWCGLAMGYAAAMAGWEYAPRGNALWARNWLTWGNPVALGQEMLADVLIFPRGTGGHVAIYVGEDDTYFHILGGNQSDAVNIKLKPKAELIAPRRCPWRIMQPPNVRKIFLASTGEVSTGEA